MFFGKATEAGLSLFQRGPSSCSFMFVHQKSDKLIGELKWSILLSHSHHPFKQYGRRVGRAPTVLTQGVVAVFDTWAILNMREVRDFASRVQVGYLPLCFLVEFPMENTRNFSSELFPKLPRNGVLEAVQKLADELNNTVPPRFFFTLSTSFGQKGNIV